ncbi:unnamed protein product [Gordionus sp. m RMFG-2023]
MILYGRLSFIIIRTRKLIISNYTSKFSFDQALTCSPLNARYSNYKCFHSILPRYPSLILYDTTFKKNNNSKNELISLKPREPEIPNENDKNLPLWQRFKIMMKKYWYVLIPVHAITTAFWLTSFWYAAKCGLDIIPLLEKLSIPEKYIDPIKKSGATNIAIAFALCKIISPIRYLVTLGVSTFSINYLRKFGYIKPIPSSQQIKRIVRNLREERIKKRKNIKKN